MGIFFLVTKTNCPTKLVIVLFLRDCKYLNEYDSTLELKIDVSTSTTGLKFNHE